MTKSRHGPLEEIKEEGEAVQHQVFRTGTGGTQLVSAQMLQPFLRTKKNAYNILTMEGKTLAC